VASLLGLLLGVGLVLARDYLDNTIKDPPRRSGGYSTSTSSPPSQYDEANVHFVTEAYQNLRTALIFGPQGRTRQIVLVTGTWPQEGKTTSWSTSASCSPPRGGRPSSWTRPAARPAPQPLGLTREPGARTSREPRNLDTLGTPDPRAEPVRADHGSLPPNRPPPDPGHMPDFLGSAAPTTFLGLIYSPPLASVTDAPAPGPLRRPHDLRRAIQQGDKK